jgi:hypothetical protein
MSSVAWKKKTLHALALEGSVAGSFPAKEKAKPVKSYGGGLLRGSLKETCCWEWVT